MILNTYVPQTAMVAPYLVAMAKTGLTMHCFNWSGIKSYRVKGLWVLMVQGVLDMYAIAFSILYFI
jgi:hypothetical protein